MHPIFFLEAVEHSKLYIVTKEINIHDVEYYLWVRLTPDIAKNYKLYGLDEVGQFTKYDLNTSDICYHEDNRIWYRFNSMLLNRSLGQHVYRMHMVNIHDDTTISLYFSYIIQREDTSKPYVYMHDVKSIETGDCC